MWLLARLCRRKSCLPDTFTEAFKGKQDQLVEEINTADYSGLLLKLQAKGVVINIIFALLTLLVVIDILTC